MKTTIRDLAESAQAGLQKVNSTVDAGLETAEKIFLTVGAIIIAAGALTALGTYVTGQLGLLPSN